MFAARFGGEESDFAEAQRRRVTSPKAPPREYGVNVATSWIFIVLVERRLSRGSHALTNVMFPATRGVRYCAAVSALLEMLAVRVRVVAG